VTEYTTKLVKYELKVKSSAKIELEKPDALLKMAKWRKLDEAFRNYLSQWFSEDSRTWRNYLIREDPGVPADLDDEEFSTEDEYLYMCTILEGDHFEADNTKLFQLLKSLVLEGECWTYCQSFERTQDGRAAFFAVQAQCEGTAARTARKNTAYTSISAAVFRGTRRNFTFQDYINIHAKAHEGIKHCTGGEETIPESKKVTDFLSGIQDSEMSAALNVVYGDEAKLNDFDTCQRYLMTIWNRIS